MPYNIVSVLFITADLSVNAQNIKFTATTVNVVTNILVQMSVLFGFSSHISCLL
jgi:hypothetical protein